MANPIFGSLFHTSSQTRESRQDTSLVKLTNPLATMLDGILERTPMKGAPLNSPREDSFELVAATTLFPYDSTSLESVADSQKPTKHTAY